MAVDLSVAFEPCVVLARGQFCPLEHVFALQSGTPKPILHVVDNFVSDIVGRYDFIGKLLLKVPIGFFALTFSSLSSAITSFL
jgi:hypothetical protein